MRFLGGVAVELLDTSVDAEDDWVGFEAVYVGEALRRFLLDDADLGKFDGVGHGWVPSFLRRNTEVSIHHMWPDIRSLLP